jgi:hypothetical protein
MGNWYKVTKRINGRLYDYWQRTERHGKSTKTFNKYIGRSGSGSAATITAASSDTAAFKPDRPEDAIWKLNPVHNPDGVDLRQYKRAMEAERREDERIQYGSLAARKGRQKQAVRDAKRKTRATKAVNPFLAQGIQHSTYYRGGGTGSMPKGLSAADVLKYETQELGNTITPEPGIDLSSIKSEKLVWVTNTKDAAKEYGKVEPITGNFRVVARDNYGGLLVERVVKPDTERKTTETPYFVSDLSPEDQAAYNAMMPTHKPNQPEKSDLERRADEWKAQGKYIGVGCSETEPYKDESWGARRTVIESTSMKKPANDFLSCPLTSVEVKTIEGIRTFYLRQKDDKYYVMCGSTSNMKHYEKAFDTPDQAAAYAGAETMKWELERAEEARLENEEYHKRYGSEA